MNYYVIELGSILTIQTVRNYVGVSFQNALAHVTYEDQSGLHVTDVAADKHRLFMPP